MNINQLNNLLNNSQGLYNNIYSDRQQYHDNINNIRLNQLQNRSIIVERHIIPADLYEDWYINSTEISNQYNLNNENIRPATYTNNTTYTNNSTSTNMNNSRTNRNNINTNIRNNQNINSQYGNVNVNTSNLASNVSSNMTSNVSSNNITRMFSNMRLVVRDNNGNQVDYNMSSPSSTNDINDFNNFLDRLVNPDIEFNSLFGNSTREIVLSSNQIRDNTTIRRYTTDNNVSIDGLDSDTDNNEQCSICRDNYNLDDELRMLNNCGHEFHIACIDEWLESNSTCPICRGSIA